MTEVAHPTQTDMAAVQELLAEYFESVGVVVRDSPEDIAVLVNENAGGVWLAWVDGVPAGCVVLRPLPGMDAAVECKRLYVRPAFRGRGLADALLDAMEQGATAGGAKWVYLDSMEEMAAALRVYRRRSYTPCARYNRNPQATVFLRKQLG